MTIGSDPAWRAWGALRPKAEDAPAKPLSADETIVLRIVTDAPMATPAIAAAAGIVDFDPAAYAAIETALVGLVERDLAELVEAGWRRKA
jgi:hypothetical protein